jgi:hypothetical protein
LASVLREQAVDGRAKLLAHLRQGMALCLLVDKASEVLLLGGVSLSNSAAMPWSWLTARSGSHSSSLLVSKASAA